ncbi:glycosyltransferase [Pontivivens nitratireducens]|uniref:Glycosyltransferase family 4 protein n=1 Tax=Pontivivens nitratireducens TaxID=2758038 RepID=A0A6G7VRJ8_9RHOB|nr:glycosyltransferase [Pontibrevibacter nitratireducens]QIK42550.1 glycosyltransferase family 4 protein [Pontibrevibacter nitratireducens]
MDRPLRIALIAHVRHPIAQPFKGGMEAHAFQLCHWLTQTGHEVTLFASGDSDAPGALVPLMQEHYDRHYPWHRFHGTEVLTNLLDTAFAGALPRLADFDVVHNNSLHRYPPRLSRRDRIPMVTSLHIPPFQALRQSVNDSAAPWCRFTVCSERQRDVWWPAGAPSSAHVLYNGIDTDSFTFQPRGNGRALWAGRITPNKGTHLAVAAAAMACGVPVAALANGATEEVIGRGGVVAAAETGEADTAEALATAIRQALTLDRRAVHDWATSRYGKRRMVENCVALYRTAMAQRDAPAGDVAFGQGDLPGGGVDLGRSAA